jgi:hypothetical protein
VQHDGTFAATALGIPSGQSSLSLSPPDLLDSKSIYVIPGLHNATVLRDRTLPDRPASRTGRDFKRIGGEGGGHLHPLSGVQQLDAALVIHLTPDGY